MRGMPKYGEAPKNRSRAILVGSGKGTSSEKRRNGTGGGLRHVGVENRGRQTATSNGYEQQRRLCHCRSSSFSFQQQRPQQQPLRFGDHLTIGKCLLAEAPWRES